MSNVTCGQAEAKTCERCHGTSDTAVNPLVPLANEGDDGVEYIHAHCARTNSRLGFCRYCGVRKVFGSDDLNDVGGCEMHEGESVPDYPEEDADSFIENIRNNE
jgi:hypothetical protein